MQVEFAAQPGCYAAFRSTDAFVSHAFVSATRTGSCGMEQTSFAQNRSWERCLEVAASVEV